MTPQTILTCYLVWLTLAGIWCETNKQHKYAQGPRTAGSVIGVLLKHGTIFGLLIWGGFYAS
jgi:hypothetical protein